MNKNKQTKKLPNKKEAYINAMDDLKRISEKLEKLNNKINEDIQELTSKITNTEFYSQHKAIEHEQVVDGFGENLLPSDPAFISQTKTLETDRGEKPLSP